MTEQRAHFGPDRVCGYSIGLAGIAGYIPPGNGPTVLAHYPLALRNNTRQYPQYPQAIVLDFFPLKKHRRRGLKDPIGEGC
jgi:hypothetical protein